jgi:hypothetical protein
LPFIQPTGIITATVARYAPAGSLPGLALNGNGVTDIFAAGTVPTTFDNPSQDVYGGSILGGSSSGTTSTTTTPPTNGTGCTGRYQYTTVVQNGQTVYKIHCL